LGGDSTGAALAGTFGLRRHGLGRWPEISTRLGAPVRGAEACAGATL
jgi:hypothetical protein